LFKPQSRLWSILYCRYILSSKKGQNSQLYKRTNENIILFNLILVFWGEGEFSLSNEIQKLCIQSLNIVTICILTLELESGWEGSREMKRERVVGKGEGGCRGERVKRNRSGGSETHDTFVGKY
jgi:hypothetical protein